MSTRVDTVIRIIQEMDFTTEQKGEISNKLQELVTVECISSKKQVCIHSSCQGGLQ